MLDSETKRRIDSARDILVGKVPDPKSQVEQITIALIYKFMDDMDKESVEMGGKAKFFSGNYKKYAWSTIFDPKISGVELVALYGEAITQMNQNPNIPDLFRDIFKNAFLPYRDPETLKSFLKEINWFQYSHSEKLGDAFEYLLSVLGSQGEAGQFRTPRHIIDFMIEIVDPKKNEVILDPACGTAGFLISAYRYILKNNSSNFDFEKDPRAFELHGVKLSEITINGKKYKGDKLTSDEKARLSKNIIGYDISPDMVRLSLVNMYLHGFTNPRIQEYDTLTSEDKWGEYADVIMANPPFMSPKGGIKPHKRFSVESNRSEVLFVDYIAEHLRPQGRAAIIVPEGIIFQSQTAYKNLRKMLIEKDFLVGVISLPAGMFNPYSGVKTSILWIDKTLAKKTDKIFFAKIENDGFDLGAQRRPIDKNDLPSTFQAIQDYKKALETGAKFQGAGWSNILIAEKSKVAENEDFNLTGERYKATATPRDHKYPLVKLGEICDLYQPETITSKEIRSEGPYKVFGANGVIGFFDKYNHEDGQVLITCRGATCGTMNFSEPKSWITGNAMVAKPKSANLDKRFLYYLLKSSDFSSVITGAAQPQITRTSLSPLQIPIPPLEVQKEIVAEIEGYQKIVDAAQQIVEIYQPRIETNPDWPIKTIGEMCSLMTGGTPQSTMREYYENGTIRWLVSGDIHLGEIFDCDGRITELGMRESNAKLLPKNSVLIALNGQGKTRGKVAILRVDATCNQSLVAINSNDKTILAPEFLLYALDGMYRKIRDLTGDNERSGLNMPLIRQLQIPVPPIEIQNEIVREITKQKELVSGNKCLVEIFELKVKDCITKVWGEKKSS